MHLGSDPYLLLTGHINDRCLNLTVRRDDLKEMSELSS